MTTRREFLKGTGAGLAALGAAGALGAGRVLAQAANDPVRPGTGAGSHLPLIDRVVPRATGSAVGRWWSAPGGTAWRRTTPPGRCWPAAAARWTPSRRACACRRADPG